jgi:hypothetical protein
LIALGAKNQECASSVEQQQEGFFRRLLFLKKNRAYYFVALAVEASLVCGGQN